MTFLLSRTAFLVVIASFWAGLFSLALPYSTYAAESSPSSYGPRKTPSSRPPEISYCKPGHCTRQDFERWGEDYNTWLDNIDPSVNSFKAKEWPSNQQQGWRSLTNAPSPFLAVSLGDDDDDDDDEIASISQQYTKFLGTLFKNSQCYKGLKESFAAVYQRLDSAWASFERSQERQVSLSPSPYLSALASDKKANSSQSTWAERALSANSFREMQRTSVNDFEGARPPSCRSSSALDRSTSDFLNFSCRSPSTYCPAVCSSKDEGILFIGVLRGIPEINFLCQECSPESALPTQTKTLGDRLVLGDVFNHSSLCEIIFSRLYPYPGLNEEILKTLLKASLADTRVCLAAECEKIRLQSSSPTCGNSPVIASSAQTPTTKNRGGLVLLREDILKEELRLRASRAAARPRICLNTAIDALQLKQHYSTRTFMHIVWIGPAAHKSNLEEDRWEANRDLIIKFVASAEQVLARNGTIHLVQSMDTRFYPSLETLQENLGAEFVLENHGQIKLSLRQQNTGEHLPADRQDHHITIRRRTQSLQEK